MGKAPRTRASKEQEEAKKKTKQKLINTDNAYATMCSIEVITV